VTSIDVLLPFYGDPRLLRIAVESILTQSDEDWRLVVVDDAYPDPAVPEWFATLRDPRLEYRRNETNLGANRNYARALSIAEADFVVFMGADDVMGSGYLTAVRDAIAQFPAAAVVATAVEVIDGTGQPVRPLVDRLKSALRPSGSVPQLLRGEDLVVSLLRGNWTYFPALAWRREPITDIGFRPSYHVVQDLALLVDVLLVGGDLALMPQQVFRYRRHRGSDSSVKTLTGDRFREERDYYREIARQLTARGMPRAARAARLHQTSRLHAVALLPSALRAGQGRAAGRLLRHALG